jgi:hypothetical protein
MKSRSRPENLRAWGTTSRRLAWIMVSLARRPSVTMRPSRAFLARESEGSANMRSAASPAW